MHREPDRPEFIPRPPLRGRLPAHVRRAQSRPYEIGFVVLCLVVAIAFGVHRRSELDAAEAASAPASQVWPTR